MNQIRSKFDLKMSGDQFCEIEHISSKRILDKVEIL